MTEAPHVPPVQEVRELDLTSDALEETAHLKRHFGRRPLVCFVIVGALFYLSASKTRADTGEAAVAAALAEGAATE